VIVAGDLSRPVPGVDGVDLTGPERAERHEHAPSRRGGSTMAPPPAGRRGPNLTGSLGLAPEVGAEPLDHEAWGRLQQPGVAVHPHHPGAAHGGGSDRMHTRSCANPAGRTGPGSAGGEWWTRPSVEADGRPLRLGRSVRLATSAWWMAASIWDHGCVTPRVRTAGSAGPRHHEGCWSDGGLTDCASGARDPSPLRSLRAGNRGPGSSSVIRDTGNEPPSSSELRQAWASPATTDEEAAVRSSARQATAGSSGSQVRGEVVVASSEGSPTCSSTPPTSMSWCASPGVVGFGVHPPDG
jgi:hypothetical protein